MSGETMVEKRAFGVGASLSWRAFLSDCGNENPIICKMTPIIKLQSDKLIEALARNELADNIGPERQKRKFSDSEEEVQLEEEEKEKVGGGGEVEDEDEQSNKRTTGSMNALLLEKISSLENKSIQLIHYNTLLGSPGSATTPSSSVISNRSIPSRRCHFKGCTKCAQGATRFCIAHGNHYFPWAHLCEVVIVFCFY